MLLRSTREVLLKPAECIFTSNTGVGVNNKHMSSTSAVLKYLLPARRELGVRTPVKVRISNNNKTHSLDRRTFSTWKPGVTQSSFYPYLAMCRSNLTLGNNINQTFLKRTFGPVSVPSFGRHLHYSCTKNNNARTIRLLGCTRSTKKGFLSPGCFSSQSRIWKRGIIRGGAGGGKVDNRIMLMVYGSCALGALLLSSIAFTHIQQLYKRVVYGIHTFYDTPFGRRQKLIKYKGVILPAMLEKKLDEIRKFPVRPDDVWVVSWPRSGTTWVQEIVYLIQTELDLVQEAEKNIEQRFAFLENVYPGLKAIEESQSPRLLKSHLPFHLLPEQMETVQPKIIYVVRNPKDILISYYSFLKMLTPLKFEGTFEEFCDRFTKDKVYYSPWGKHVRDAWDLEKEGANILIVKYEDLHKDLAENIERIANFLGKKLSSEQKAAICKLCQFQCMRRNNSVNYSWWDDYGIRDKTQSHFLRKGQVGDWKNHITAFISRRVEKMVQDNLGDTDLVFDYELATTPDDTEGHD